jgi:hypothetical protein
MLNKGTELGSEAMPSRLDRVEIQLTSRPEPCVISWAARDELIFRLQLHAEGGSAIDAIRAVGASRPVQLTADEKEQVLIAIYDWMRVVGSNELPPEVFDLRSVLINDLHDAGRGA